MRKLLIVSLLSVSACAAQAQELFDALSIVEQPIQGTARAVSMSGAFGALGGDATSLTTNPAGLGIYRSCEATISLLDVYSEHRTPTDFMGRNRFTMSQGAYVHAILPKNNKVLKASNFAFSYNRLKNFQNRYQFEYEQSRSLVGLIADQANAAGVSENSLLESAKPFENPRVGWLSALGYSNYLINPTGLKQWTPMSENLVKSHYKYAESGSIDEFNVSYAANIAHWVYLGASVGIQSIEKITASYYDEAFYSMGEEQLALSNRVAFSAVGWNLKLGLIVNPVSFMRIGFAYHTPTLYSITQHTEAQMESRNVLDDKGNRVDVTTSTGDGYDKYQLQTPSRFMFSTAFIIKKKGLIGIDYELTDYRQMMYADDFATDNFSEQNAAIRQFAQLNHTLKLGGEYRVLDFMSLRVGGAFTTPSVADNAVKTLPYNTLRTDMEYAANAWSYYVSGGVGFRWTNWGIDIAYQYRQQYATFAPFAGAKKQNFTNSYHNILLTGSFRF